MSRLRYRSVCQTALRHISADARSDPPLLLGTAEGRGTVLGSADGSIGRPSGRPPWEMQRIRCGAGARAPFRVRVVLVVRGSGVPKQLHVRRAGVLSVRHAPTPDRASLSCLGSCRFLTLNYLARHAHGVHVEYVKRGDRGGSCRSQPFAVDFGTPRFRAMPIS